MFPILGHLFGYPIHSYGFFLALGYITSLIVGYWSAKIFRRDFTPFLDIGLISIITGVVGARVLFVLTNWKYFSQFPQEIFDIWRGGLVFYGGFLFAIVMVFVYIKWKKIPIAETLDICAPAMAAGHAVGRIGCFAAGCCHGSVCQYPWGISLNSSLVDPALRNIPLHPTQLYEAFSLMLLSFFLYSTLKKQKMLSGGVSLLYLAGYALIRFVIEIFRGDSIRGFLIEPWLSTSQAIALLVFLFTAGILVTGKFRRNH